MFFLACGGQSTAGNGSSELENTATAAPKEVTINVVTSFGGNDGNRKNYEEACESWEQATGNKVNDSSAIAKEEWKAKVLADFETGSEADVLLFFTGVDSNPIVEAGKVVPLKEIQSQYPDYASNMAQRKMEPSPFDNEIYAVPTTGYWEGLYVNKKVLQACGLTVPDATTTWDEFLEMCQTIKEYGYTPIAASLSEVPHYWFEFVVLNNEVKELYGEIPQTAEDPVFAAWEKGLMDLKELYEKGYLPANTLTATDNQTMQLMIDNKAAFVVDGSWKIGWFTENMKESDTITVTYVPAREPRVATDIVGGLSMGYFITRKAWDNPEKRDAVVSFVQAMTSNEVIGKMAGGAAVTALKGGTPLPENPSELQLAALAMVEGATDMVPAAQDRIPFELKEKLLTEDIKKIATGEQEAAVALQQFVEMLRK